MHLGIALNAVGVAMTIAFNENTTPAYIIAMNLVRGIGGGMITCPALIGAQGAVPVEGVLERYTSGIVLQCSYFGIQEHVVYMYIAL
jgi:hypothetical protein